MSRIFGHLLPAVALAASGCIYTVQQEPPPGFTRPSAPLRLRVGVTGSDVDSDPGSRTGMAVMMKKQMAQGRSGSAAPAESLAAALRDTGLFQTVQRVAYGTRAGYDVIVELSQKQDRTMHAFFPFFFPLCDPLIIGCIPFYSLSERFTAEVQATVSGGPVYSEVGESHLKCTGNLGCAPASHGDPEARAAAVSNAAAKIAADFVKDANYYRGLTHVQEDEPVHKLRPSQAPEQPAAKARPWWEIASPSGAAAGKAQESEPAGAPEPAEATPQPAPRPKPTTTSDSDLVP